MNALRTTRWVLVMRDTFQALRQLRDTLPKGSVPPNPKLKPDELELFDVRYRESASAGFSFEMDQPGNWSELPADFVPAMAHAAAQARQLQFGLKLIS